MTPIWQAECPDITEDSADEDIWETAFKAWPTDADRDTPFPDLADLLGLPQGFAPPLSPCVSHLGLLDAISAFTCTSIVAVIALA